MRKSLLTDSQQVRIATAPLLGHAPRGPLSLKRVVLQNYRDCGWATRLFLKLRWRWTPYEEIAGRTPAHGPILDLGCGHGLLALTLALQSHRRDVMGVDHDERRLRLARRAARGILNAHFTCGDFAQALDRAGPAPAAIVIMDALHYLRHDAQAALVKRSWNALRPGGMLIVREVNAGIRPTSLFNQTHERLMTACGLTRARHVAFRSARDWECLFASCGFSVESEPCGHFPFADQLYLCHKL